MRIPRALLLLLLLTLLAVAPLPASAQSKSDVDRAKQIEEQAFAELRATDDALLASLEEMERIEGQVHSLNLRIKRLTEAIVEYGNSVTNLQERSRLLVIEAYKSGGRSLVISAFSSATVQELITSHALYDAATTRDLSQLGQLAVVTRQMERLSDELTTNEVEVEQLRVEHRVVVEKLESDQVKAAELHATAQSRWARTYRAYRAELARRAVIAAARSSGAAAGIPNQTQGVTCPVAGPHHFIDSWGFPRSGGRTHKGTDLMASFNTPLVAMASGTVRLNRHHLGGIQVWVRGDDGIIYYYAHLSKWPRGLRTGDRVHEGQVVGYIGDTGNARGTPHLHLGMIAGGVFVNPYPTVRAAC